MRREGGSRAVRSFSPRDRGAVVALWGAVFAYPEARNAPATVLDDKLDTDPHGVLVAELDGCVHGTLMFGFDGHRGWLYRLAVSPDARGRGLARMLVDEALARLAERGCRKVNLQVKEGNEAAMATWTALGFTPEPRRSFGRLLDGAPLGLHHGTSRVVPYRPAWARCFEEERKRLQTALGGRPCEHVGSTSVVGLCAKPILDLAVGLRGNEAPPRAALEALGYLYLGDGGDEGGHLFVLESRPGVRTHHLHAVTLDGPQWRSYLRFRARLREDPEARERYATEKRALAARYPGDRPAYTESKGPTILEIIASSHTDS